MQLTDHGHSALGEWEVWGGLQGAANEAEGCIVQPGPCL